eukprot:c9152_g1_i2.p1 GENE.c9152_g1_i2~~c9152_g1_i2.p1  ORF type:complete len:403 (-),score=77.12 c9152_g1_i2:981-2189(-)
METLKSTDDLTFLPPDGHCDALVDDPNFLHEAHVDESLNLATLRLDGLGMNSIWNLTPEEGRPDYSRMSRHSTPTMVPNTPSGETEPPRHPSPSFPGQPTRYMRDPHPQFRNMSRPSERSRPTAIGRTYDDDVANLAFYKTVPCKYRNCKKGDSCPFAHGPAELRTYKTAMCKAWEERGFCVHGDACTYAHGEHELRSKGEFQRTVAAGMTGQYANPSTAAPAAPDSVTSAPAEIELAFAQVKAMRLGDKIRVRHMMESILKRHHGHMMSTYSVQLALNERKNELRLEKDLSLLNVLVFGMMYPKTFRTNVQTHIVSLTPSRRSTDSHPSWTNKPNSSFNKLSKMELGILGQLGLLPHLDVLESHSIDFPTLMRMDESDVSNLQMLPAAVRNQIASVLSLGA